MGDRVGFDQVAGLHHSDAGRFRAQLQTDFHLERDRRSDVYVLGAALESGGVGADVVVVKRNVVEREVSLAVRGCRLGVVRDRILNLHVRAHDCCARWIQHRAFHCTRVSAARLSKSDRGQERLQEQRKQPASSSFDCVGWIRFNLEKSDRRTWILRERATYGRERTSVYCRHASPRVATRHAKVRAPRLSIVPEGAGYYGPAACSPRTPSRC